MSSKQLHHDGTKFLLRHGYDEWGVSLSEILKPECREQKRFEERIEIGPFVNTVNFWAYKSRRASLAV